MNRLNMFLTIAIVFFSGALLGLYVSPLRNVEINPREYRESYDLLASSKVELQKSILNFYMNSYCEGSEARVVDFKYHNTMFQGVYCDRDSIMLLSDSFPPLPFFILDLTLEEENE